jgi:hypothetical protein
MTGLVQQKATSSHLMKYYPPFSTTQSGENILNIYPMIIWSQFNNISYEISKKINTSYLDSLNELLSIPKNESSQQRAFSSCVNDGIRRYKLVNSTDSYDTAPAKIFLTILESLSYRTLPRITFYEDAVKARIIYNNLELIIDYDFEEPESVFISAFEGDKLIIKDGPIKDIFKILESF